jgi:hypothetical protein
MRYIHPNVRRHAAVGLVLVALLVPAMLLAACGGNTVSSQVLLAAAATKLSADQTFHFELDESNPGTASSGNYDISSATGDVQRPDKMSASAKVTTAITPVNLKLIVIGSQVWLTNPLTGQYQPIDQLGSLQTLLGVNLTTTVVGVQGFFDAGLAAILTSMQNVSAPSDGTAHADDGQSLIPCWKISGDVSTDKLSALTGGQVPAGQQIPVTVCIGKDDGQLRSVTVTHKLTAFDTDQTTRIIYLTNFNKPVTIQPPTT